MFTLPVLKMLIVKGLVFFGAVNSTNKSSCFTGESALASGNDVAHDPALGDV